MCPTRLGVGPPRAESSNGTEATGSSVSAEIACRADAIRRIRTPLGTAGIGGGDTLSANTGSSGVSIRICRAVYAGHLHCHCLVRKSESIPQVGLQGVIRVVVRLKFAWITRGTGAVTRPLVSQLTLTLARRNEPGADNRLTVVSALGTLTCPGQAVVICVALSPNIVTDTVVASGANFTGKQLRLHHLVNTRAADANIHVGDSKVAVARTDRTGLTDAGFCVGGGGVLPCTGGTQSAFTFSCVHIELAIWTLCADVGGAGGRGDRIFSSPARGTLRGVGYE